jgi:hypothetical protein
MGEVTTWPQIEMIRDRTRISRVFGTCIGILTKRVEDEEKGLKS